MDEWARQRIKTEAEMIRDEIRGGTLYGQPLDESDVDMFIVAIYNAGVLFALNKFVLDIPISFERRNVNDLPDMSDKWVRMKLEAESGSGEE